MFFLLTLVNLFNNLLYTRFIILYVLLYYTYTDKCIKLKTNNNYDKLLLQYHEKYC